MAGHLRHKVEAAKKSRMLARQILSDRNPRTASCKAWMPPLVPLIEVLPGFHWQGSRVLSSSFPQ